MSGNEIYPVPNGVSLAANIDNDGYLEMYRRSIEENEDFWREQAEFDEYTHSWDVYSDIFH